jgi:hypothetical protein
MSDRMNPRKEYNGPGRGDVKGNVLIELDDAVERCLPSDGNEGTADRQED